MDWWRSAVMYQVYPRSFADGDGVGDLVAVAMGTEPVQLSAGTVLLRSAPLDQDGWLPYIASPGVDGIWMTAFQLSPQVDQGNDVSDYCGVDPLFGTMEQVDSLLELAHSLGLRILLDVVSRPARGLG